MGNSYFKCNPERIRSGKDCDSLREWCEKNTENLDKLFEQFKRVTSPVRSGERAEEEDIIFDGSYKVYFKPKDGYRLYVQKEKFFGGFDDDSNAVPFLIKKSLLFRLCVQSDSMLELCLKYYYENNSLGESSRGTDMNFAYTPENFKELVRDGIAVIRHEVLPKDESKNTKLDKKAKLFIRSFDETKISTSNEDLKDDIAYNVCVRIASMVLYMVSLASKGKDGSAYNFNDQPGIISTFNDRGVNAVYRKMYCIIFNLVNRCSDGYDGHRLSGCVITSQVCMNCMNDFRKVFFSKIAFKELPGYGIAINYNPHGESPENATDKAFKICNKKECYGCFGGDVSDKTPRGNDKTLNWDFTLESLQK